MLQVTFLLQPSTTVRLRCVYFAFCKSFTTQLQLNYTELNRAFLS